MNPVRIVIDKTERLPENLHLFDGSQKTIYYSEPWSVKIQTIELESVLWDLHRRNIQSLIVEGGQKLLQSFLDKGFYDEIRIFKSKKLNFIGIHSPELPSEIKLVESRNLMDDELRIYRK